MEYLENHIIPIILLGVQGIFGWFLWSMRQSFVSKESCQENREKDQQKVIAISQTQFELRQAISGLNEKVQTLPTANNVSDLKIAFTEMKGTNGRLEERLNSGDQLLRRVEHQLNLLIDGHLEIK